MKLLYKWSTRVGDFFIGQTSDGRYHPIYDEESLGSYSQPWQAAEDLAGGHTFSATGVDDTSVLGIPEHHSEWEKL
jgi:hypothetical protein